MLNENYKTIEAPSYITHALKHSLFDDSFIAGGIMRDLMIIELCKDEYSFLKPEMTTKDIDIYFKNIAAYDTASQLIKQKLLTGPKYETKNATCYIASYTTTKNIEALFTPSKYRLNLDLVKRNFGSVETILNTFDFTVSQCAFYKNSNDNKYYITMSSEFEKDLISKHIALASGVFTDHIIKRVLKYIDYGFTISSHETLVEALNLFVNKEHEIQQLLLQNNLTVEKIFEANPDTIIYFFDRLKKYYRREESMPSYEDAYDMERAAVTEFYEIVEQLKSHDPNEEIPYEFLYHNIGLREYEVAAPELNFFQERLLRLLSNQVIGKKITRENAGEIFDFTYRYDIASQKPEVFSSVTKIENNILCRFCGKKMNKCIDSYCSIFTVDDEEETYGYYESYRKDTRNFQEKFNNEAELVYKTFIMGYDKSTNEINDEWFNNVAEFWLIFKTEQIQSLLSLKEWHNMIDNHAFDPSIPFKLLVNLSKTA